MLIKLQHQFIYEDIDKLPEYKVYPEKTLSLANYKLLVITCLSAELEQAKLLYKGIEIKEHTWQMLHFMFSFWTKEELKKWNL